MDGGFIKESVMQGMGLRGLLVKMVIDWRGVHGTDIESANVIGWILRTQTRETRLMQTISKSGSNITM